MSYKLYLKQHIDTGLKYLGITEQEDPHKYQGSGSRWKSHIKKHGYKVTTEVLFESDNHDHFKLKCEQVSDHFNIVENKEFANLIPETGDKSNLKGQTKAAEAVQGTRWVTNGKESRRVHLGYDILPEGYHFGKTHSTSLKLREKSSQDPSYYVDGNEIRYSEAKKKYGARFTKAIARMKKQGVVVYRTPKRGKYESLDIEILAKN